MDICYSNLLVIYKICRWNCCTETCSFYWSRQTGKPHGNRCRSTSFWTTDCWQTSKYRTNLCKIRQALYVRPSTYTSVQLSYLRKSCTNNSTVPNSYESYCQYGSKFKLNEYYMRNTNTRKHILNELKLRIFCNALCKCYYLLVSAGLCLIHSCISSLTIILVNLLFPFCPTV